MRPPFSAAVIDFGSRRALGNRVKTQQIKHQGLCNKQGQTIREVLRRLVEQDRWRNAPADRLPVELTEGLAGVADGAGAKDDGLVGDQGCKTCGHGARGRGVRMEVRRGLRRRGRRGCE